MVKKTRLTPKLIELARQNIMLGFSYSALASSLNISEDTLYLWFRKAKDSNTKDPIYSQFFAAVKESEAALLTECLQSVKVSMKSDVKAAFFMLERRFANDGYGKSSQLDIKAQTENKNMNLNVNTTASHEEIEAIRMRILEKLSRPAQPPMLDFSKD
jgi:DNA-binding transcriptional regulator YiaG